MKHMQSEWRLSCIVGLLLQILACCPILSDFLFIPRSLIFTLLFCFFVLSFFFGFYLQNQFMLWKKNMNYCTTRGKYFYPLFISNLWCLLFVYGKICPCICSFISFKSFWICVLFVDNLVPWAGRKVNWIGFFLTGSGLNLLLPYQLHNRLVALLSLTKEDGKQSRSKLCWEIFVTMNQVIWVK